MSETQTQIDVVALIEEMAAIYIHVEVEDGLDPETLAEWRETIERQANALFAKTFSLRPDYVEIEVVLIAGSFWAKLMPRLQTIALFLSLYNGAHSLPQNIISDWHKFADEVGAVAADVTKGTVDRVSGPWDNTEAWYEFVQRINPTTPHYPE
jgi:hypothetical protein